MTDLKTKLFMQQPKPWQVRIAPNSSWAASIGLLVKRVLFQAPSSLIAMIKDALLVLVIGLVTAPVLILYWIVNFLINVAAGLAGRLSLPINESQEK